MQIKIYFNNKPLFLTDQVSPELEDYLHRPETIFIDELNSHTVKTMILEMQQPQFTAGIFLHSNIGMLLDAFKKKLVLILAAGGLVYTPTREILLIYRRGKWDLPKGKLDEGEDLPTCAVREIQEETGLDALHLERPLTVTYHTYYQDGQHILKESHWYLVKTENKGPFVPQLEEDIEKCEWVPLNKLTPYMDNTHASIADVIARGKEALVDNG
jgi:8-oxo-dGTP pyrophosphatase MutT (NUDIX family)